MLFPFNAMSNNASNPTGRATPTANVAMETPPV